MRKINFKNLSFIFYLISLFLPVFLGAEVYGIFALISGFLGFIEPNIYIVLPWFSNALFLFNFTFESKIGNFKFLLSFLTITCSLFTFGIETIPLDEGGAYTNVKPNFGFYIWIISYLFLLLSQVRNYKKK
ncbi:hypothetical protein [Polaribacter marinivivus]|uniref:Uncharacterized protein n=1 Tax=Polaribacter marinivivus TaxID=1524260 RepID=A0ABV8R9J0_9FLAO